MLSNPFFYDRPIFMRYRQCDNPEIKDIFIPDDLLLQYQTTQKGIEIFTSIFLWNSQYMRPALIYNGRRPSPTENYIYQRLICGILKEETQSREGFDEFVQNSTGGYKADMWNVKLLPILESNSPAPKLTEALCVFGNVR